MEELDQEKEQICECAVFSYNSKNIHLEAGSYSHVKEQTILHKTV